MKRTAKTSDNPTTALLKEASKLLNKIDREDLYGYSNIGLKMEKGAKRTQKKVNEHIKGTGV